MITDRDLLRIERYLNESEEKALREFRAAEELRLARLQATREFQACLRAACQELADELDAEALES